MTEREAKNKSFDLMANVLGLDEFQRIAARELLDDLEGFKFPPAPGSEHEKKLMALGAICGERWFG